VVSFVEDFLGSCTALAESHVWGESESGSDVVSSSREIDRSTSEVIRARDSTHLAVAKRRAAAAGEK